jgi:peptidoglycan/xylan/chitin deacetylase (PgdA/CDA1 family)
VKTRVAALIVVTVLLLAGMSALHGSSHRAARRSTPPTTVPENDLNDDRPPAPRPVATKQAAYPPGPLTPLVSKIPTTEKVAYITIDDGVVRDPRVLAFEKREHLPITMFLVRWTANAGKTYWNAMQAAGATVQDHTITHRSMRGLPYDQQNHEICSLPDEYKSWFGKRPVLFRPPYGDYDSATRRAANSCGMKYVVLWTATMANGVLAFQHHHLEPGTIILLHFKSDLYDELVKLVGFLHGQGYTVGRLEHALGVG